MYDHELERRKAQIRSGGQFKTALTEPEDVPVNVDMPGFRHALTIIGAVLIVTVCVVSIVGLIPLCLFARATAWTE